MGGVPWIRGGLQREVGRTSKFPMGSSKGKHKRGLSLLDQRCKECVPAANSRRGKQLPCQVGGEGLKFKFPAQGQQGRENQLSRKKKKTAIPARNQVAYRGR